MPKGNLTIRGIALLGVSLIISACNREIKMAPLPPCFSSEIPEEVPVISRCRGVGKISPGVLAAKFGVGERQGCAGVERQDQNRAGPSGRSKGQSPRARDLLCRRFGHGRLALCTGDGRSVRRAF